jgi:hypothetical protein
MNELDKDILESYRDVQRKEKILIHIENILKHFRKMTEGFLDLPFSSSTFVNILKNGLVKLKRVRQQIQTTLTSLMGDIEHAENSIETSQREKAMLIIHDLKRDCKNSSMQVVGNEPIHENGHPFPLISVIGMSGGKPHLNRNFYKRLIKKALWEPNGKWFSAETKPVRYEKQQWKPG